jgi:hypothetical protein
MLLQVATDREFPTEVSRDMGWLCMEGKVSGWAVTPRPWQPHTLSKAEQLGGTTHLDADGLTHTSYKLRIAAQSGHAGASNGEHEWRL